ncbi:MAG TPA: cytochrome c [Candidatus Acidoferrum sp.]|nr:cytochrome c [Candidatus Acidoferrum sp.]
MFSRTTLALSTMLVAAGLCFAQQPAASKTEVKKTPIKRTNAASGKEMFAQYCAPCHGTDGTGNGPAAPAMKISPTDLTQLAKKNGGEYPSYQVAAVLKFGSGAGPHGSKDMPVWGPLLQSLDKYHDEVAQQRVANIVGYIESLQAK